MTKPRYRRRSAPRRFNRCSNAPPALELLEARDLPSVSMPTDILYRPLDAAASTAGPTGMTPSQIRHAYGFDQITFENGTIPGNGAGTTIAVVDAFDDPTIASDLAQFDAAFGLPNPTFTKVNETGGTTYPAPSTSWACETALDVEWSHAIAPLANILLVEANDNAGFDLYDAVQYAASQPGVVVVSMSFGEPEYAGENVYDSSTYVTPAGHPGVSFVASSGDNGAPPSYPAASPNVLSVGGTTLDVNSSGNILAETGWDGSAGGISSQESQPSYQNGVVTQSRTQRTNPDVAYDSDPATGFPEYNSYTFGTADPWAQFGGTSAGAPQWSALIAIADQGRALAGLPSLDGPGQLLPAIYSMSAPNFNDITTGVSDGTPPYTAGPGYDLVTGRGTPRANLIVPALVAVPPVAANVHLLIATPSSVTAGTAFDLTVEALDANGNLATTYTGTIQVTSSDPQSMLPSPYSFTAADGGIHAFSITLETAGAQTITVTGDNGELGGAVSISVLPNSSTTSTFTVTSTGDDGTLPSAAGALSLRQAIELANQDTAGPVTITFALGPGVQTIYLSQALPALTTRVTINAAPPPAFPTQEIVLEGPGAGLNLEAGGSIIRGDDHLAIGGFVGGAITLGGQGGDVVEGTFIGTNTMSGGGLGNWVGIIIDNTSNNTIGGTAEGSANYIAGNTDAGIIVSGASALDNVIEGNVIGTDIAGTGALGNGGDGIGIEAGASGNTIGGAGAGVVNLISGNQGWGIVIDDGAGNLVDNNAIGTDVSGRVAIPNHMGGVEITDGAINNTIGGGFGAINLISGNGGWGVVIDGSGGNLVDSDVIGTDVTGTAPLGNQTGGVEIKDGSVYNTVGATVAGTLNLIGGNLGVQVLIDGASFNVVASCVIGADVSGMHAFGDSLSDGVRIQDGAQGNTIGGTGGAGIDLISGNQGNGVTIAGGGTDENVIIGDVIGADVTGETALGNQNGVVIEDGALDNQIGQAGGINLISGNRNDGVLIEASGNSIQGNVIGADGGGSAPLPNGGSGVEIVGNNNVVGDAYSSGSFSGFGNIIAFNAMSGVMIDSGTGNGIHENSIFRNGGLGINLAPEANGSIMAPVLTAVTPSSSGTRITGTLSGTPDTTFLIEFYLSASPAQGQAQTFFFVSETTNAAGNVTFIATTDETFPSGLFVTATTTDPAGETSEFSQAVAS